MRNHRKASIAAFLLALSLFLRPTAGHALSCAAARTALGQETSEIRQCLTVRELERNRCHEKSRHPCLVRLCRKAELLLASSDVKWFCVRATGQKLQEVITEISEADDLAAQCDAI